MASSASTIVEAIREHRLLLFRYHGLDRTVEPYLYGINRDTGSRILSAYQVGGFSRSSDEPGWRNFIVSEVGQLRITEERFEPRMSEYNPHDERFRFVFARV